MLYNIYTKSVICCSQIWCIMFDHVYFAHSFSKLKIHINKQGWQHPRSKAFKVRKYGRVTLKVCRKLKNKIVFKIWNRFINPTSLPTKVFHFPCFQFLKILYTSPVEGSKSCWALSRPCMELSLRGSSNLT